MTLEVTVSEVVTVTDVFESIKRFFVKIAQWFAKSDEEEEGAETVAEDSNKSPPESSNQPATEASPPDLGVQVSDESNAGESFGP